jgi:hypothetical protein
MAIQLLQALSVLPNLPVRLFHDGSGVASGAARVGATLLCWGGLTASLPLRATAQDLFIYPAGGQSAEQQRQDSLECRLWAMDQTGFDPTAPIPDTRSEITPEPRARNQGASDVARSTARGALVGTAAGAIMGNTGRGALAGTAGGAIVGAGRQVDQSRDRQQASRDLQRQQRIREAEQQQLLQYRRQAFNRAVTACLEGRGYSVS